MVLRVPDPSLRERKHFPSLKRTRGEFQIFFSIVSRDEFLDTVSREPRNIYVAEGNSNARGNVDKNLSNIGRNLRF